MTMKSTRNNCSLWCRVVIVAVLPLTGFCHPFYNGVANARTGRNIQPLPCATKQGETGVCMFAWDCMKANGTHLGTCIDRFYFGSCCKLKPGSPKPVHTPMKSNFTIFATTENSRLPPATIGMNMSTGGPVNIPSPLPFNFSASGAGEHPDGANLTSPEIAVETDVDSESSKNLTQTISEIENQQQTYEIAPEGSTDTGSDSQHQITAQVQETVDISPGPSTVQDPDPVTNETSSGAVTDGGETIQSSEGDLTTVVETESVESSTSKATEQDSTPPVGHESTITSTELSAGVSVGTEAATDTEMGSVDSHPQTDPPVDPYTEFITHFITEATDEFVNEIDANHVSSGNEDQPHETVPPPTYPPFVPSYAEESEISTATLAASPEEATEVTQLVSEMTQLAEVEIALADATTQQPDDELLKNSTIDLLDTNVPIVPGVAIVPTPDENNVHPSGPVSAESNSTIFDEEVVSINDLVVPDPSLVDNVGTSEKAPEVATVLPQEANVETATTEQVSLTPEATEITTEQPSYVKPETSTQVVIKIPASLKNKTSTTPSPTEQPAFDTPEQEMLHALNTSSFREICGRPLYPSKRIVGGSEASFGEWPWQLSLRQWRSVTFLHKCGAALVNENWAITAAHCVENAQPDQLLLRLGEYDLERVDEDYGHIERKVQIIATHPQFDPRTFEYDLALLRFNEPVHFQPNIIPICIPDTDYDFIGDTGFVTGWGRLYEAGPLHAKLQVVSVPVIGNDHCSNMFLRSHSWVLVPDIMMCAGYDNGKKDACEGDSGGPMVIRHKDRWQLAGVISWGIGCALPNQPGVYTRISAFRDWINKIIVF